MTVLILDHPASPLPPYLEWLADCEEDLVLFTGRPPARIPGADQVGYAEVRCFADYASSPEAERAALELAGRAAVSAIVATAHADLIRAGALRDHLGLPGQRRDSALVYADLVTMRERLTERAVPVIPFGPVRRAVDLYWYAHQWGYPIRVRQRRAPGWALIRVVSNEAELTALIPGMFEAGFDSVPSLLLEPHIAGTRMRAVATGTQAAHVSMAEHAEPLLDLLNRTISALPDGAVGDHAISAVRRESGDWLVDSVGAQARDYETRRRVVRSQAGLLRERRLQAGMEFEQWRPRRERADPALPRFAGRDQV